MIKELTLQLQDLKSSHSSTPIHQSSTQPTPMLVDQVQREPRKDNSSRPRKQQTKPTSTPQIVSPPPKEKVKGTQQLQSRAHTTSTALQSQHDDKQQS